MQPVDSGVDQLVKQIAFQSVNGHAISSSVSHVTLLIIRSFLYNVMPEINKR